MPKIDISIIIVNYNVKDYLLQCLRSIEQAKMHYNVETIVVDNHSADGSVEFLQPLFPEVSFIKLDENLGFGRANNIGIKIAKGKYVLILNPDTLLEEKTLDIMYHYMESHSETAIAGCKVLNPDGSFQLACRRGFPTPWASFCKLFGLQKIFPGSKFFARYNQTFKNIDDTYYVDAVIGAFMFIRTDVLKELKGFDEDFFMYGEDLDLCYRASKSGWKTAYIHETSIIHYKGESTKRSSINEVRHFYNAMEIFASKHFSYSAIFLLFLRMGIFIRSVFAYINKNRKQILIILTDIFAINFFLIIGTKIRFGNYFSLPNYAYPTVFIAVTSILLLSMIAVGEYFEGKPTIRKSFTGLMIAFFVLSSLTYFFNNYAFSRGIVLMMTGFTVVFATFVRALVLLYNKLSGREADIRIAFIGSDQKTEKIIDSLQTYETRNADLVGIISVNSIDNINNFRLPLIGNIDYLPKIIDDYNIHEIIITDKTLDSSRLIKLIQNTSKPNVRFHAAQEYEDVVAARIINEIIGIEPTIPVYNISKLRYKFIKRIFDILFSLIFLSIGRPAVYLLFRKPDILINKLWKVLKGEFSVVGIDGGNYNIGKSGIISLPAIYDTKKISRQTIENLNNYYLKNYTFSLDIEIFIKYLFRKKSGN